MSPFCANLHQGYLSRSQRCLPCPLTLLSACLRDSYEHRNDAPRGLLPAINVGFQIL